MYAPLFRSPAILGKRYVVKCHYTPSCCPRRRVPKRLFCSSRCRANSSALFSETMLSPGEEGGRFPKILVAFPGARRFIVAEKSNSNQRLGCSRVPNEILHFAPRRERKEPILSPTRACFAVSRREAVALLIEEQRTAVGK